MIKELIHDPILLAIKSTDATKEDIVIANDLLETLIHHRQTCVGMAANMIGVHKRIIAFLDESGRKPTFTVMFNPEIIEKSGLYETEEGCLSLEGVRPTTRYENIEVEYMDMDWKKQRVKLSGWTAQICQHELDHLEGKII